MKQGELWKLSLDPVKGREQADYRPALIVSGNLMNTHLDLVIVCPLTTSIKHYKGNAVIEPTKQNGLSATSEVLTFHVRSVSKLRLMERIGTVESEELKIALKGLNDILKF
jgi:mRNA interferase MazF